MFGEIDGAKSSRYSTSVQKVYASSHKVNQATRVRRTLKMPAAFVFLLALGSFIDALYIDNAEKSRSGTVVTATIYRIRKERFVTYPA